MTKSLTEKEYQSTKKLIDQVLEPKIREMIEATNKILKNKNIQIGAELQWFMDSIQEDSHNDKKKS